MTIVDATRSIQTAVADHPNTDQPRSSNHAASSQAPSASSQKKTVSRRKIGSAQSVRRIRWTLDSGVLAPFMTRGQGSTSSAESE